MIQENTPAKVGLLELLLASSGVQFVIPAYQRNYTWTANREVKQLLDDIKAVLKGERNKHFIGIIYLERSLDFSRRERSVIDGQQRLTTLFLSLYAERTIWSDDLLLLSRSNIQIRNSETSNERISA